MDSDSNVVNKGGTINMDSTPASNVVNEGNTINMDSTSNVVIEGNTINKDSTSNVFNQGDTINMDSTSNVVNEGNTINKDSTSNVVIEGNTINMDSTTNVVNEGHAINKDSTSNVFNQGDTINKDSTSNVVNEGERSNMDSTSNVVNEGDTINMDSTSNVVNEGNTINKDSTSNVVNEGNTINIDSTSNVVNEGNTSNMKGTSNVVNEGNTINMDGTSNVVSEGNTINMEGTSNVVNEGNTINMDSTSNVVNEGDTINMDSTSNVVIEGNTINMEGTSNVVNEGNTINMDSTSNLLAAESKREHDRDISDLKQNLAVAKDNGDKYCKIKSLQALSNVYRKTNEYDEASVHAEDCIRIIQELSAEKVMEIGDDPDSPLVAGIYINDARLGSAAANAYYNLGLTKFALSFEDSLDCFQKGAAIASAVGEEHGEVASCYCIAKIYEMKGQWDDVIEFSTKYIDKMSFCSKKMQIKSYLRLATAFYETKNYKEALVYNTKCMDAIEQSPDATGLTETLSVLSIGVATIFQLNNYDGTINCGKKYLELAVNTGTKEAEMDAHYFLAAAYDKLHQFDCCFQHGNKGMKIAEELKDDATLERFKALLSNFYVLVGMNEKVTFLDPRQKTVFEVPTSLRQELEVLEKAVKTGDVLQQIMSQFRLCNYYKSKHQYENAANCLKQAMELDDHKRKLTYYSRIAITYLEMQKYKEGLEYCEAGLREVAACKHENILFFFFFGISKLYAANNKWQQAEECAKKAVQCFETLYTSVGINEEFKMSAVDKHNQVIRELSLVYLQTGRKEEALLVLDRCRARALKDTLIANYGMQGSNEVSDMKLSDIEALVSGDQFAIFYYSNVGFGYTLAFMVWRNCLDASATQLFINEKKYHRMIDKMFDEIEVLQEVNCEDRTLDTEQHTTHQKQEEEEEDDDERESFMLRLPKRNFLVQKKTIMMEFQGKRRRATILEFLYSLILGDKQPLIKQSEIVFIPDGSLCKIPFAALQDPDTGKYLSETKRIRLAPSLATLKLLSENAVDDTCSGGALVIGDPDTGKVMLDNEVKELPQLEQARNEANILANLLGFQPLIGDKATKPAVIEKLREGASVVHIAAHGSLTQGTIVLAPSPEVRATKPIPDEEDYMLTMADVQQAKVRAQLVVLSCCHSGRGEIRAEGVVGMCRAFLASGARAVVASLWAIDDEATLEFMVIFYLHLKDGKSASTSLQLTMNEMRSIDEYREPKYWAPFFLMGDDVTVKFT